MEWLTQNWLLIVFGIGFFYAHAARWNVLRHAWRTPAWLNAG
ncbi:hypothetical protein [Candidatus Accumulibacter phosphatis]|nr:hypothetical protein [Candidatus Accumulibacter phosphatis]